MQIKANNNRTYSLGSLIDHVYVKETVLDQFVYHSTIKNIAPTDESDEIFTTTEFVIQKYLKWRTVDHRKSFNIIMQGSCFDQWLTCIERYAFHIP